MSVVNIRSVPHFRSGIHIRTAEPRLAAGCRSMPSAHGKEFDPFWLDTVNQCLWRRCRGGDDERILLKPKAFDMLRCLVEHAGRLVTQEQLLEAVWPDTHVQPEVLKRHMFDIRNVLGDDPKCPAYIETLPRRGYQFIAPVRSCGSAQAAFADFPAPTGLVGRDRALADLRAYLGRTLEGSRQIVFVTGEAGIGKTALLDEFQRQAAAGTPVRIARGQCVEGYGGKEPYYAVLEAVGGLCNGPEGESVVRILAAQAPTWLVQFPSLVTREQREMLQREIQGTTRQRMLREIVEALETIASEIPLLLVLEDLHWVDPSTVDLISALARSRSDAKLMVIGTYRPADFALSGHPLRSVEPDLLVHRLCHELALEGLKEADIGAYLAAESVDGTVPEGLAALLHEHSDGNPLFMEAALEHLAGRGLVSLEDGRWQLQVPVEEIDLEVPERLRRMIELQIDRLSGAEQRALEAACITGNSFTASVTASAADTKVEDFVGLCEGLERRNYIVLSADAQEFPDGSASRRYRFVHALYSEVLYRRQWPGRRAKLHLQIGERLEALCAARPGEAAAELAHHFEEGGDAERAAKYRQLAGRRVEVRPLVEIPDRSRRESLPPTFTLTLAGAGF